MVSEGWKRICKSIRKKFPITTWHLAFNTQKYIDKQEESCRKQAEEYFKDKLSLENTSDVSENNTNQPDETAPGDNGLMIGKTDFDFNDVKEFLSGFPNNSKSL